MVSKEAAERAMRRLGAELNANADRISAVLSGYTGAKYRFTSHRNEHGTWCDLSLCSLTDEAAKDRFVSGDHRCSYGCPDSDIEPAPIEED